MDEKQAAAYLFETDFIFLTDKNELFLKNQNRIEQRKLCTISKDQVQDKLESLQDNFDELKSRVNVLVEDNEASKEQILDLEEELKSANAVGNFDALIEQLEGKLEYSEKQTEEDIEMESKEKESTGAGQAASQKESNDSASDEPSDTQKEDQNNESDPLAYYKDIVKQARALIDDPDWQTTSDKLDNLSHQWSEGPDTDADELKKLYQKFTRITKKFEDLKEEHQKKKAGRRQQNLDKKKKLLEELEGIISNKTWTATRRISQMKQQWNGLGSLPSGKGEGMDERFDELIGIFNEHKVDRLVQQRQSEEDNLMGKLVVLEKMEKVVSSMDHETTEWKKIDEKFDDLTNQWKKIGRVAKDKADEVWDRFKKAQDDYYDKKYKYDKDHQSNVDTFKHKKKKICEEAEALFDKEDLASAARQINKLHRRWKKAGNLPQRDEDKLWDRFKAATDSFNEKKSNNQDKIQAQEEEHYKQKLELIEKAEQVKDTDDFKKGHDKMQNFMHRWKKIGPVSRKKSNKIWKKFKGAMDTFYDRRRDHFKDQKEEQKENLEEKEKILEQLQELGGHEDPIEAVEEAKKLQETFKNVGYVPIKQKDRMWKLYREACDVIYDRFRAAKSGNKFDQELAKANLDADERNKIQKLRKEFKKVKSEARDLEKEVLQFEEKKTYFKPSNSSNPLLDKVIEKIEHAEEQLEEKQQKMDSITEEMEEIRAES